MHSFYLEGLDCISLEKQHMTSVICMAWLAHPREEHLTVRVQAPAITGMWASHGRSGDEGRCAALWTFFLTGVYLGWSEVCELEKKAACICK